MENTHTRTCLSDLSREQRPQTLGLDSGWDDLWPSRCFISVCGKNTHFFLLSSFSRILCRTSECSNKSKVNKTLSGFEWKKTQNNAFWLYMRLYYLWCIFSAFHAQRPAWSNIWCNQSKNSDRGKSHCFGEMSGFFSKHFRAKIVEQ